VVNTIESLLEVTEDASDFLFIIQLLYLHVIPFKVIGMGSCTPLPDIFQTLKHHLKSFFESVLTLMFSHQCINVFN